MQPEIDMPLTSDRDLVEASLSGDIRAFTGLVERYRYAVFGLCLNHTRDFDAAEDAAQEALVKAFLKLRNLDNADRFAPWLKQIAVNECRMAQERLRSFCGARISIYLAVEEGELWLSETQTLVEELGLPLVEAHFLYHRDWISLLRKMGRDGDAIQIGRAFLRQLETERVDDPTQRRWWISEIWGRLIRIYGESNDLERLRDAVQAARENLLAYEEEWRDCAAEETNAQRREDLEASYGRFNSYANGNLAHELRFAGLFDQAIEYTERALNFKENGNLYMGLACGYMGKNDRDGALEAVQRLCRSPSDALQKWVYFGGAKRWFEDEVFDSVRQDREFLDLIQG